MTNTFEDYPFKPNALEKKILEVENDLRNCQVEEGFIFDNNGNKIAYGKGTETELKPEDFDGKDLKEGSILTHYHTDNDSLTQADIKFGMEYGYVEIRAVTDENLYIIRFPKDYNKKMLTFWLEGANTEADTRHELWVITSERIGFEYYQIRRTEAERIIGLNNEM